MIVSIIISVLSLSPPLILAAYAALANEKVGIINIGIEGFLTFGAFVGACLFHVISPELGIWRIIITLLLSGVITAIFSTLFAFLTINMKANNLGIGFAFNIFSSGLAFFLAILFFQTHEISFTIEHIIPGFKNIPVVGDWLFNNLTIDVVLFFFALLIGLMLYIFLEWTKFGLRFLSIGENSKASEASSISVKKYKWIGMIISGFIAGIGGCCLIIYGGQFRIGIVSSKGYIALAIVIFGRWKLWYVTLAAILFSITTVVEIYAKTLLASIPEWIIAIFPYLFIVVFLMFFAKTQKNVEPAEISKWE